MGLCPSLLQFLDTHQGKGLCVSVKRTAVARGALAVGWCGTVTPGGPNPELPRSLGALLGPLVAGCAVVGGWQGCVVPCGQPGILPAGSGPGPSLPSLVSSAGRFHHEAFTSKVTRTVWGIPWSHREK